MAGPARPLARTRRGAATRRGRPRSEQAHRAILDAARHLLIKHGFAGLRLEHVAARAGVGKATIYRRWRSRDALALELVTTMAEPYRDIPDVGDTRRELLTAILRPMIAMAETDYGKVLRTMLSRIAIDPAFRQGFRTSLVNARQEQIARVLARGVARGDLLPATDPQTVTDLLMGALIGRLMLGLPLDRAYAERVVDLLLRGCARRASVTRTRRARLAVRARARGRSARPAAASRC